MLFLEWSSARRSIQGFLFWIWELFFKFRSQNTFFGKFGIGASKYFIWNETCYKGVFGGADSEIDNCLLNSVSKAFSFLEEVCPETWKLYVLNETKCNEIFKSANSRYNFSTLFFFIINDSEPHGCLFSTSNLRKRKLHPPLIMTLNYLSWLALPFCDFGFAI